MKQIAILGIVLAALQARASNLVFDIKCAPSSTFFTASTDRPNFLVNNSVINGWYWQNCGPSTACCYRYDYPGYVIYRMVITNVPAGYDYFAIVRNNNTGNMARTSTQRPLTSNSTVYLGQVTP